jgi:hypothetical protein
MSRSTYISGFVPVETFDALEEYRREQRVKRRDDNLSRSQIIKELLEAHPEISKRLHKRST